MQRYKTKTVFLGEQEILSLDKLELIGSKIKALTERGAARDLYDIDNIINEKIVDKSQSDMLRKIIIFYTAIGKGFPENFPMLTAIDKISFSDVRSSLLPVLRKGTYYDIAPVKERVKDYLTGIIKPTEREMLFMEKFNNKEYRPEYLFEDADILSRIKNHPMALWKTRK